MICAAAPATLRIARLAEADSQVGRPALRIVRPGCSIRDPGRWVCAFRRDGSHAALADAGGSVPVVGGQVGQYTLVLGPGWAEPRRVVEELPTLELRPGPAQVPRSHPRAGDAGRRRAQPDQLIVHRFSMLFSASETANSSDAANPGCFCSSNLRTYSRFSIGCLADFMDIPSPPIRGPPRNERGSPCRPRRGCP